MEIIIFGTLLFIIGLAGGWKIPQLINRRKLATFEEKQRILVKEASIAAEAEKQEKVLEAKESILKIKSSFEEETNKKRSNIHANEQRLKQRESNLSKQLERVKRKENELETKNETLNNQLEVAHNQLNEYNKLKDQQILILEKAAGLPVEKAQEQLMKTLEDEARTNASAHVKQIVEEAKITAVKEARKIVIETIQRTAAEHAIENSVSVFNIENDDIKGKIIGREGRNISALEAATGIELIVDDTPEAIIISGFDPIRREIARLALHRLVRDGRIHPAKIEEIVNKTKKNINQEIVDIGEQTVIDLGIHGLHPELIKMVGRMRFRSSYAQNLLQHSREVANLAATMAAELGLNTKMAKRAGLLHDIGKVWPDESEKTHAIIGMELALKYNENKEICNAIGAHHNEIEMNTLISPVVQACDAISGSRPGARREIVDQYIKRLKDMEAIALGFSGVKNCFAIQAGRELRVIVDAHSISDKVANDMSFNISQKIENEMQYPGQVKVTVIRETRSVSYAK